jgi:hypothetical protein
MDKTQFVEVDTSLEELAHFMHDELCNCDDKNCENETLILDWLKSGDPYGMNIDEVCQEAELFFFGELDYQKG